MAYPVLVPVLKYKIFQITIIIVNAKHIIAYFISFYIIYFAHDIIVLVRDKVGEVF